MTHLTLKSSVLLRGLLLALFLTAVSQPLSAEEPLHARIDQLVEASTEAPLAQVVGDNEFIRRVCLDLTGMPPSIDLLKSFLADNSPDKREKLVAQLLASDEYARHMTTSLDIMLMERRRNQHIKQEEWYAWLFQSVKENKPWNQIAKEILGADGTDPETRAAVRFYLDRGSEPNLLTRDVARMFFGKDLQCAQCHDHPIFDDYKQADFHGLYSFLAGGYEFKAPDKKTYYAEKAGGEEIYASVFLPDFKEETAPKLPSGAEIAEPKFYPGDEYKVKPDKTVRPVLKYSRRQKLAELATNGENRAFNENIANRLWAHMLGRGIVDPVDLHHTANPPSHPQLLKLLGEEIARMNFDMRAFLKEIALSKTYQRSIDLPADLVVRSQQEAKELPALEQELAALQSAAEKADEAYAEAVSTWSEAKSAVEPVKKELREARKKSAELYKPYAAAEKAVAAARAKLQPKLDLIAKYEAIVKPADGALKLVKTDEELTKAIAPIRKKLEAVRKEAEPLQKAVADKEAALKKPQDALQASWKVIDEIRTRLAPLEQAALAGNAEVVKTRQAKFDAWNKVNRRQAQFGTAKLFASYGPAETKAIAAAEQHQQALTAAREAAAAVESLTAEFQTKQKTWQTVSARYNQTSAKLASAEADMQRLKPAVEDLKDAQQSLNSAIATMKSETELTQFVGLFEEKTEAYQTQLTTAEKSAADMQTLLKELQPQFEQAQQEFTTAEAEMNKRLDLKNTTAEAARTAETLAASMREAADAIRTELTEKWASQFAVAPLKPLMPEQFAWSILQVTGVRDRYEASARAELDKKQPLSEEDQKDPAKAAAREDEVKALTYQKLQGSVKQFINVYGAGDGQNQYDFFATVDQALFAANGSAFVGWVKPSSGNVTERMMKTDDLKAAAEDLYLTYLTREPAFEETQAVVEYIKSRPEEKQACIEEIAWALLNSAEFRFNH
jgi:hypothetical protein